MVQRIDIERALDKIASDEGGFRFQSLAVVLAKLRWPELIACERHNDRGLDAYASISVSPDGRGKGLAFSTTGTLDKVKSDAEKVAFRRAADLSWRGEAPRLALGNLYSKSQVPTRAVEALDQAATLFPSSSWPHWFKALALTSAGSGLEEQALPELELAQELAPNQPGIYPALLVSALRRNDCGGAARIWTRMVPLGVAKELDPSQWCDPHLDSTSRRASPSDNVFDRYSETRLLAAMANDNSDSPASGR
jgi:hypothetical protein